MTLRGAAVTRSRWTARAALAMACLVALGCSAPTTRTTFPPIGSTPAPAGDATSATRQQVVAALAAVGLQAVDAIRPYRPFEGPLLAAAPRTVLQALPDDSAHGNVVIYALGSGGAAQAAASDHASYIATGPGKVLFSPGSRFELRVLGQNVIFFTWSPDASPDPRLQSIQEALNQIGTGVPIPG